MNFKEIWERIKNETIISNYAQLAKEVETTHQYVSRKKKADNFPVKWAYLVARKYNLSTEWIMTGQGPKRLQGETPRASLNNDFLHLVDEWLNEMTKKEPRRAEWFRYQFEDSFPAFKEWLKRKESKGRREDNTNQNVA